MKRAYDGDNGGPAGKATLIEVILSTRPGGRVYNSSNFFRSLSSVIGKNLDAGRNNNFSNSLPHPNAWKPLAHFLRTGEVNEIPPRDIPCVLANASFLEMPKVINLIKVKMNDPSFCASISQQLTDTNAVISADLMLTLVDNRPLSKNSKLTPIGGVVKAWASRARGAGTTLLSHALSEIEVMTENCYLQVEGSEKSGVDGIYEELAGLRNGRKAWRRTADYKRDSGMTHFSSYMFCPPCIYWCSDSSTWCLEWANPSYLTSARKTEGYFVQQDVDCPSLVTKCWIYKQKEGGRETHSGESKPTLIIARLKQEQQGSCVIS